MSASTTTTKRQHGIQETDLTYESLRQQFEMGHVMKRANEAAAEILRAKGNLAGAEEREFYALLHHGHAKSAAASIKARFGVVMGAPTASAAPIDALVSIVVEIEDEKVGGA